jgi:hypothetical protein
MAENFSFAAKISFYGKNPIHGNFFASKNYSGQNMNFFMSKLPIHVKTFFSEGNNYARF